jgi:hypothetical protein
MLITWTTLNLRVRNTPVAQWIKDDQRILPPISAQVPGRKPENARKSRKYNLALGRFFAKRRVHIQ